MNRRLARLGLLLACTALAPAPDKDAEIGRAFRVPYRLTETNHFLVRVRVNGKGPFNFLVDTGAPALYVATETAKKVGLKPDADAFWTAVDRLDFEGGATLKGLKARVEDPFQLVGMNALGLPGASIDGILGFTVLAKFRMEIDLTQDRMTWTRLDFDPKEPPVPARRPGDRPPADMQAMNALGPLARFAAALVGKQPEDELRPRGALGLALGPKDGGGARVTLVLAGSPADKAGLRVGDRLLRVNGGEVTDGLSARAAAGEFRPGSAVTLTVHREGAAEPLTLSLTAGEGL